MLGAALALQGKLVEAEECHRQAIACREGCKDEAYLNLGLVLRGQERYPEAAAAFEEALRLCPDYPQAEHALADVRGALRFLGDGG